MFEERAKRFKDLDEAIRSLNKWVSKFVEDFGNVLQHQLSVCDGLGRLFAGDGRPPEVDRFWSVHYGIRSRIWPDVERQLSVQVISPLRVISDTLTRPLLLIEKRRNKLLDYDKLRNRMDKAREVTAQVSWKVLISFNHVNPSCRLHTVRWSNFDRRDPKMKGFLAKYRGDPLRISS